MASNLSECTPLCKSFRCDKKPSALRIKRRGNKKTIWCTWIEDECDGPWCQFSLCLERKMTEDGRCKKTAPKPKPAVVLPPDDYDDYIDPDAIPKKYTKKIRIKDR